MEQKKAWWKEAVVYQIYPRSFQDSNGDGIGDLQGIYSRLDYLKKLGVDVLWLSPIYQSPNDDNGYDISDYRKIMQEFGTMEDFDRLLLGIHERGMRLIMDLVVNHTSDEHPWFMQAKEDRSSPFYHYYIWKDPKNGGLPNNWGSRFSGPAWEWNEKTGQYYLHIFTKKQVDLNWENPQVRGEVYDLMRFWLDKGIDGFRMDVINAISKDPAFPDGPVQGLYGDIDNLVFNGPKVHQYLQEMNREVLSHYDIMTVGETVHVTEQDALHYAGAETHELNMIHQFQHLVLDHDQYGMWTTKRAALADLKEVFTRWQTALDGKAWNTLFWNNHDEARAVSRFGNDLEEYREKSAKMLATCLYFMQGTPYLYQGEELGMTNVHFEDLGDYEDVQMRNAHRELVEEKRLYTEEEFLHGVWAKGRDNCRTPMQWDGGVQAGFTTGTPWIKCNPNYTQINAADELEDPNSVFYYYQKIIALRHQYDLIVYGSYQLLDPENEQLYVYRRDLDGQSLLVVSNFTDREADWRLPQEFEGAKLLLTNEEEIEEQKLSAYGARVYIRCDVTSASAGDEK